MRLRALSLLAAFAVLTCVAALGQVHDYSTIVVFGDSLSDTGNVLHLSEDKYGVPVPGPILPYEDYTVGRFTDGADTIPAAQNYFGVWIEQLAAALPSHPAVIDSLDGGTNYAYGFATTANSTSPLTFYGPSNSVYSVQVENIGQQITDYLATHPHIDKHTLFVVWGGSNDVLDATSSRDIFNAAVQQTLNLQRLIQAGATQFLVPNLPPLGLLPRLNGSTTTSTPATAASLLFNAYLSTGIGVLKYFYPRRRLNVYQLDVFHIYLNVVASPSSYLLTNVTTPAETLQVDPDTYLFWDDLHPTTRGHNILAGAAIQLMSQ
ncbi:MAG TPA: SGNH/GDSL hydrolase family protein [Terracidiphilus sp.]|nr:SGNH/GDSL hydrolase family protein [Terracidiphilus sp.]